MQTNDDKWAERLVTESHTMLLAVTVSVTRDSLDPDDDSPTLNDAIAFTMANIVDGIDDTNTWWDSIDVQFRWDEASQEIYDTAEADVGIE